MAENENTQLSWTKETWTSLPPQEVSADMLEVKMTELSMIEEELFSSDGKISADHKDSIIDEKYAKEIKKATDLKTKIEIVEWLIIDFRKNMGINAMIKEASLSKYSSVEEKKILSEINRKMEHLLKQYPNSKNQLVKFMECELKNSNFYVNFYENTGNKEDKNVIPKVLQGHYQTILSDSIPSLEKLLKSIEKNNFITDNESFLNYLIEDNDYKKLWWDIDIKLSQIFQYEIFKEWFCDNESSPNFKDTFWYGTIVRFMGKWDGEMKKINDMYINPNKHTKLVQYIDRSSQEIKDWLLASKKVKDIYIAAKKTEVIDIRDVTTLGKLSDEVILKLSNISDQTLKLTVFNMMKEILKSSNRDGNKWETFLNSLNLQTNSSQQSFDINNFISDGWMLDKLIDTQTDPKKKIQIAQIFQIFIEKEFNQSTIGDGDIWNKMETKTKHLQEQILLTLEQSITNLKQKYKDNPQVLLEIDNYGQVKDKETWEIEKKMHLLDKYQDFNTHSQSARPEPLEKTQSPILRKEEIQHAQDALNRNGLGKNRTIDAETGKIVSKDWLEKKQLAIQNGEEIPKDDTSTIIDKIGRRWQIEFWHNHEMIFTSSLGYTFNLDNDIYWVQKALDINDTFDYLDKIWLWYFGDNLANMAETIKTVFWNEFANVSLGESSFLKPEKTRNFIDMFKKIWFINENQSIERHNATAIHDMEMTWRLKWLDVKNKSVWTPWWNAFSKGTSYDSMNFRRFVTGIRDNWLVQNSNKV